MNERAELSRALASSYPAFENLRDGLLDRRPVEIRDVHLPMLELAERSGLVHRTAGTWQITGNGARRYLTGGWLEEYVALAVRETGADEVLIGQKLRWRAREYTGENEIDVLARFGSRLFMCSCKALKSALLPDDVRTRERLM
ncbi:MAG: Card1-like endonuclease domain-containing protein, partial [Rhizobium oryzihabitans]